MMHLNTQVKRRHDVSQLDPFPSKKLLKMSPLDLEERRVDLERFFASCMLWGCGVLAWGREGVGVGEV